MFFTRSLRAKTLFWALLPTVLVLVAVAIIALYSYEQVARDVVRQRDAELARITSARLFERLAVHSSTLQALATGDDLRSLDPDRIASTLGEAQSLLNVFDAGFMVYDGQDGVIWPVPVSGDVSSAGSSQPEEVRQTLARARQTLRPAFSGVFPDPVSGRDVVMTAAPIPGRDNRPWGILVGVSDIRISLLGATFAEVLELQAGASGFAFLVDGNGRVIYHRDTSQLGQDLSASEPVLRATGGQTGAIIAEDPEGEAVISGFAPLPCPTPRDCRPWTVITQEEWGHVVGPIQNRSKWLLALLVAGGISTAAFVFLAVSGTLKPIRELTRGAERIAGGDFEYTITTRSGDEVQALAEQFNTMAWTLNESYAGLERRVQARTEELWESEERYRTLFEESRDAIFIRSMAGKIVDVNQATLDLFGFTREVAIGSDVSEMVINDEEQARFNQTLAEVGSVNNFEQRLRRRDGTEIDCLVTAILRRDQQGDRIEVQGIIRDITERIRAEQELKESHEAERRLAEESALLAEIGKTITATLNIDEVYGKFASDVKKLVDFDRINVNVIDHDAGTFVFRYVSGLLQPGRRAGEIQELDGSQTEHVLRTGRSLVRPDVAADARFHADRAILETGMLSSIMVPLNYQGRVMGTLSLRSRKLGAYGARELAVLERLADQIAPAMANAELYARTRQSEKEMREAEEKYQSIFDESKDPILVFSMDGRCLDVNQAALGLFGYDAQELLGLTIRDMCVSQADHSRLMLAVNQQGSVEDYEIHLLKKDGTEADCLVSLTMQRDNDGNVLAYQGMVHDVTERKRTEEAALQQTRDVAVLEERNRMAREIHDTLAQGFTGIILQLEAAEQVLDVETGDVQSHLGRAKGLARDSLQEARRSVWGLIPHALEQHSLDQALREEVRRCDPAGRIEGSFILSGEKRELPPDVQTALLRVCQESLNNVRRHAGATEVSVGLEFHPGAVRLYVQDNGEGFDPSRAKGTTERQGFGLTGMEQRARLLEGSFHVKSQKGKGTLVQVDIPTN